MRYLSIFIPVVEGGYTVVIPDFPEIVTEDESILYPVLTPLYAVLYLPTLFETAVGTVTVHVSLPSAAVQVAVAVLTVKLPFVVLLL